LEKLMQKFLHGASALVPKIDKIMPRVLGLINARGGSKGVPRKNIKLLLEKPLIAYSIEAALNASRLDRVVVSTDDEEIREVARCYGADVPFIRPNELATDTTLQIDVIVHALRTFADAGEVYDVVVILQPTCPLRTSADIDGALKLMEQTHADTVISVTEVQGQHPFTMYTQQSDGLLEPLLKTDGAGVLRQQFPKVWWRNGAIYAVRTEVVLENRVLYGKEVRGYPMPVERSANIDEPIDWIITESLLRNIFEKGNT
jgi:CMP-N,N'-diacetyllegionaminic acid synthase